MNTEDRHEARFARLGVKWASDPRRTQGWCALPKNRSEVAKLCRLGPRVPTGDLYCATMSPSPQAIVSHNSQRLCAAIDADQLGELQDRARDEDRSVSSAVRLAIRQWLERDGVDDRE
jgi:hypothetical protein